MISLSKIKEKYLNSHGRSRETLNNILLSGISRIANIVAHLLVVPLTINYLNPERYGIWLTLSTIIGWITFLDLGLGNGFRNRFAEAKAVGNEKLAREYLSTTYFAITSIVIVALFIIVFINNYLDWSSILNVSNSYKEELNFVFLIIIMFTCGNMIANIFASLLAADQKVGYASIIQAIGQYLALFVIYILTKTTEGSLSSLAIYYSGVPFLVMLIASIVMFSFGRYRKYRPSLTLIRPKLIKDIMNLGVQFFVIHLCMIAVFQLINIVISRELGAESVTLYNVANKYFNIIYMTAIIVITPFWSAFTDAFTMKDYQWMSKTYRKLLQGVGISFVAYLIMLFVSPVAYKLWIGSSLVVPFSVSAAMMILVFFQTYAAVNMYIINGIGAMRIQLIIYVLFGLIAWPLLVFSSRFGLTGVIIVPSLVYLTQGAFIQIQIRKIINKSASGIWLK